MPVIAFVDADAIPATGGSDGMPRERHPDLLERLANDRVMIVFCSARTRAEVEGTRQAYGVFHPFICENGAAAFVPERYFGSDIEHSRKVGGYQTIEFAAAYEDVVETIRRAADRLELGVLGFHDMSVELVARECGLSLLDARLAKLREYTEPFRLLVANPVAERRFLRALDSAGLSCMRRGGFHYASTIAEPQQAIAAVAAFYRAAFGRILTAGPFHGVDVALDRISAEDMNSLTPRAWLAGLIERIEVSREHRMERDTAPEHAATSVRRPADHRRFEPRTLRP